MVIKGKSKYIRYKKNHVTLNHEYSKHTLINLLYPRGFKLVYNDCGEFSIGKALNYHDLDKCYRIDVVLTNKVTKILLLIEIDGSYHRYGRAVKKTARKEDFIVSNYDSLFAKTYRGYKIGYYHLDPKDLYGKYKKSDEWILEQLDL